ncbi:MAG: transcription antitermination factor NusB [Phycisphaerales bacterium]|nr:transcription antitermination factor NusB [Phycisphaerales bacterium]
MSQPRDRRRVALQVLYQLDSGCSDDEQLADAATLRESLETDSLDDQSITDGIELGRKAWNHRSTADAAIEPLTPDWPIRRQPTIDRNILRLAWYEMHEAGTPPKVTISEAIELAREFSTAESPSFVNGVLDKLMHDSPSDRPTTGGQEDSQDS